MPIELVSNCGTHFLNDVIATLQDEFLVIHNMSAPYHPQANGQAESTNKTLCTVITKLITTTRSDWETMLQSALWAYRVAYKSSTGTTPFNLAYGMNAVLPMDFLIPTLRVAKNLEWTGHDLSQRIDDLEKLDESCLMAIGHMYAQKRQQKQHHDLILKPKELIKGDLVLVYTLKPHIGKFKKRGFGPCVIEEISSRVEV